MIHPRRGDDGAAMMGANRVRDPLVPTVIGATGRFVVQRELGRGATAVAYLVLDRTRERKVAVKLLFRHDQGARARFRREFESCVGVEHINVARALEFFEEDDDTFFTMELVEGQDLLRHVRADLPPGRSGGPTRAGMARLQRTLPQLVAGLRAVHRAGLVHRDLRPENVLVTFGGRVVLLDYGMASGSQGSPGTNLVGTAEYMAPEQSEPERIGPACDFYAVGVLLFQMLTGSLPFTGRGEAVLTSKRTVPAPHPSLLVPDIDSTLANLCAGLLQTAPERRPSGEELAAILAI